MASVRRGIQVSASLLVVGIVVAAAAGVLHPSHELPNDHVAAFTEYANSSAWTVIHLGQFVGMAMVIAAFLLLSPLIDTRASIVDWLNRLGVIAATAALVLYAVLQAVDGVGLKQAVDTWSIAPEQEKMARFAVAEGMRWAEWAVRSYFSFLFACALIFFGLVVALTRQLPRLVGALLIIAGAAYAAQGWVLGLEGFSDANSLPTLLGIIALVVAGVWMLVAALALKLPEAAAAA